MPDLKRRVTCAWCHAAVLAEYRLCWDCGHEVGKPRAACQCEQCARERYLAALTEAEDRVAEERRA